LATLVIGAHGGIDRWSKVASIQVTFNLSGAALAMKSYSRKYQPTCTVDVRNIKVVFQGLGHVNRDDRWIYTSKRVWIERRDGTITASRDNLYEAFSDHTASTPWDDLIKLSLLAMLCTTI
jgi:hypothetical protein